MNDDTKAASLAAKEAECAALRQRVEDAEGAKETIRLMNRDNYEGANHYMALWDAEKVTSECLRTDLADAQADCRRLREALEGMVALVVQPEHTVLAELNGENPEREATLKAIAALSATVAAGKAEKT